MTSHELAHFGLTTSPFTKEIEDVDLWMPASTLVIVDTLVEALSARQSVLLTGEPGVGKTCVLRALRRRLPEAGFRLTYCHNATLGRRDFYRHLCLALGLNPKGCGSFSPHKSPGNRAIGSRRGGQRGPRRATPALMIHWSGRIGAGAGFAGVYAHFDGTEGVETAGHRATHPSPAT